MANNSHHTTQLQPDIKHYTDLLLNATYPESDTGIGTGTSSAKYSTDGSILGNNSGASLENIISLHNHFTHAMMQDTQQMLLNTSLMD